MPLTPLVEMIWEAGRGVGSDPPAAVGPNFLSPRRTTLITYYSNTPDHDSLRNPCWPVAATTEDQNRHKMAPVPAGLVWPAPGCSADAFQSAWEPVTICPRLYSRLANIVNRPESAVETSTDSTRTAACDQLILFQVVFKHFPPNLINNGFKLYIYTRGLGALQAPTSSWRLLGPLDFTMPLN